MSIYLKSLEAQLAFKEYEYQTMLDCFNLISDTLYLSNKSRYNHITEKMSYEIEQIIKELKLLREQLEIESKRLEGENKKKSNEL